MVRSPTSHTPPGSSPGGGRRTGDRGPGHRQPQPGPLPGRAPSDHDPRAVDWTVLPVQWRQVIADGLPDLAQDIADAITSQVREFRDEPGGPIYTAALGTVGEAVQMFLRGTVSGASSSHVEVFRKLGRHEAEAGRSHDTLQATYRVASRIVMRQLLEWGRTHPGFVDDMDQLSSAVFAYIDQLAEYSAQGFDAANIGGVDDVRGRTLMVEALLDPHPVRVEELRKRAARLQWELPTEAAVIEVGGLQGTAGMPVLTRLANALSDGDALGARAFGRHLVVLPGHVPAAELRLRFAQASTPAKWLCAGPSGPRTELPASYRLVRRASMLRDRGALPPDTVLDTAEHLLAILQDLEQDVFRQLARRRLAPLYALSLGKRVKYGRVLSAWLETGGQRELAPGVLDKHRQTLRYQLTRLEQLFGEQLRERTARVELLLALRAALPAWEAELAYAERHAALPADG